MEINDSGLILGLIPLGNQVLQKPLFSCTVSYIQNMI